jgi:putative chitinase
MNRKVFFDAIRPKLFRGSLSQSQVEGMEIILDAWDKLQISSDLRHLAYPFATAYLETDRTMQPIKEYGDKAYFTKNYDIRGRNPKRARALGNIRPGDGIRFCGRGFVMLTWHDNYEKASRVVGHDLVADPDAAMRPEFAAPIMFLGMRDGWFTGHKLSEYFDRDTNDPVNARRIINGLDRAEEIAVSHKAFFAALEAAHG